MATAFIDAACRMTLRLIARRGDRRASIVDLEHIRHADGDLVKLMSWYDNEGGYADQMLREAVAATRGDDSPEPMIEHVALVDRG